MENVQKMETPNLPKVKRILHKGMSGNDVKFIQERLDTLNQVYKFCPISNLESSGTFGRTTHTFVTFFQIFSDICTDGWVDKVTANSIEDFFQSVAQTYAIPVSDMRHPVWDKYN